jgi:hypothetical protein
MSLADNPDVRQDMQNVRLALKAHNPRGYSAPVLIQLPDQWAFDADIVPLYYVSAVVRKDIGAIMERPKSPTFDVKLGVSEEAFKIVLYYANGNSNSCNWAADLDDTPHLASSVWECAVKYKIDSLESLVRDAAFDAETGSMNEATVVRLIAAAPNTLPSKYREKAIRFIAYRLAKVIPYPGWNILSYSMIRTILKSPHLRATQRDKYDAITVWQASTDDDDDRGEQFYRLMMKCIQYPLCTRSDDDFAIYNDVARYDASWGKLAPIPPANTKRREKEIFVAFPLDKLFIRVGQAKEMRLGHVNPRFVGQFKAFKYYWQLEVPMYSKYKVSKAPQMGAYLRLLHGSPKAGDSLAGMYGREGKELGALKVRFRMRIHSDDDFDKYYRATEIFDVDMLNLPRGLKMYGYPAMLGKKSVQRFLARPLPPKAPSYYISVEMFRVKEEPPSSHTHMDPDSD